ncbi:N-acetyltransferase [Desulfomarina profundi]|uniref:N-acetyltransferase n=1 Tax=Desulfomarina profundi TaxID=2772557 RepID=A0A8D5FTB1_9BACT|nr:acyltransferase [Desulfomarina profundi]BCL61016.1 N-acetyltransferase [Desulfomarina profundi]
MKKKYCRISGDVELGEDVTIHAFVNLYGCSIGSKTKIGTFVEIQKGVLIGEKCKISSHTFICEGVHIANEVFIGHNVTFVNDLYPRATREDGLLQDDFDWDVVETVIERNVSIGSGATILCGITVGSDSIVGAGSVVVRDIPAGEIWVGNPAKFLRRITE